MLSQEVPASGNLHWTSAFALMVAVLLRDLVPAAKLTTLATPTCTFFMNILHRCSRHLSVGNIFVNKSPMLVSVGSQPALNHPAAHASQTVWKQIALCFLFNLD